MVSRHAQVVTAESMHTAAMTEIFHVIRLVETSSKVAAMRRNPATKSMRLSALEAVTQRRLAWASMDTILADALATLPTNASVQLLQELTCAMTVVMCSPMHRTQLALSELDSGSLIGQERTLDV